MRAFGWGCLKRKPKGNLLVCWVPKAGGPRHTRCYAVPCGEINQASGCWRCSRDRQDQQRFGELTRLSGCKRAVFLRWIAALDVYTCVCVCDFLFETTPLWFPAEGSQLYPFRGWGPVLSFETSRLAFAVPPAHSGK